MASQNDISARIAAAKKEGFSDDQIYSSLAANDGFGKRISMAKKEGYSDADIAKTLGLSIQKDLGQLPTIQVSANRQPFDWKATQQKSMQEQAKKAGPTHILESALLGFSDLGAGLKQADEYLKDSVATGLNKLFGTSFDNKSYDRFTNQRQDIEDFQKARRQQYDQGFDWARLGGQVVATAPLGGLARGYQGVNVLSKAGAGVAAQNAAVGAAIGGSGFAGDANQRLENTAFGAVGGAAGGAIGEKIGQGINKAVNAVRNSGSQAAQRTAQAIDKNLDDALRQQGMSLGELSDDVANGLRKEATDALKSGKNLNPEAVARKAVLDRLGLKGTRAQISGNAIDWQKQAELAKLSGAGDQLRGKLIEDNVQLQNLLNKAAERTGGNATDQFGAMQNAASSLTSQLDQNKHFIGAAYDAAKKAPGNDVVIDGRGFANDAFTALEKNYAASSLPPSVQKIIKDVADNPDKFTLGKSEELIKILNREYKSSLQMGQPTSSTFSIGLVRDALNGRQAEAMQGLLSNGNDAAKAYQFARQANQFNANQIEQIPFLQDIRKGIEPDKLFNKHILNGNVNELGKTIDLLNNVNPQAVNDIKQQVVQFISNKAVNQNGQFSPAGMKNALDSIGDRRLATMFSPDELKNLKDIGKAGQYLVTQPPHSYVNNSNTSAALMNYLGGIINRPGVRVLLAPVKDIADNRAINNALTPDVSGTPIPKTPATPAEQSLVDRLMKLGLLGGAGATRQ
ncbi:hypothetical protein [Acinetobacter seifertii]|uniref:hypothetical protein n=1 Tax=Acinetobacter seifertii TaxID=1530123 RepID=UPI003F520534